MPTLLTAPGLTTDEARKCRAVDGPNTLPAPWPPPPLLVVVARQLVHFFALLLWGAAVLAVVAAEPWPGSAGAGLRLQATGAHRAPDFPGHRCQVRTRGLGCRQQDAGVL